MWKLKLLKEGHSREEPVFTAGPLKHRHNPVTAFLDPVRSNTLILLYPPTHCSPTQLHTPSPKHELNTQPLRKLVTFIG